MKVGNGVKVAIGVAVGKAVAVFVGLAVGVEVLPVATLTMVGKGVGLCKSGKLGSCQGIGPHGRYGSQSCALAIPMPA